MGRCERALAAGAKCPWAISRTKQGKISARAFHRPFVEKTLELVRRKAADILRGHKARQGKALLIPHVSKD
jgi:hypothetical protein